MWVNPLIIKRTVLILAVAASTVVVPLASATPGIEPSNIGPGPRTSEEMTSLDWKYLHDVTAVGRKYGFTFKDPLMAVRLGHDVCNVIGIQGIPPKEYDDAWWAVTPEQGKHITETAIVDLCPWYTHLIYW
jgi:hypothetical protein